MPDTLCRLAIHATGTTGSVDPSGKEDSSTVDLVLPADCPVAVLIPPIVDIVLGGPNESIPATQPQRWYLTRIGGTPLDVSMTLRQNAIHDGEMIVLTAATHPVPRSRPWGSSGVVTAAADQTPPAALQSAASAASLAATVVTAAALAWTGAAGAPTHLWTAAVLSAASATGAVVIGRSTHRLSVTLSLASVVFAMVTGFLAAPNAAWAPAVLLTAAFGFAISILLLHMTRGNTAMLTAFAAVAGAVAAVSVMSVAAQLPFRMAGAVLTVLSLAALSAAPKVTVAVAGLGPSRLEIGDRRAAAAHRVLTGLVVGWASSATLGVAAVAAGALPGAAPSAVVAMFAADVGVLLLLRQRTHIDVRRRVGLVTAGLCASAAAFLVTTSAEPEHAYWLCTLAAVAGVATLRGAARTQPLNPVVRQGLQVLEYFALAAVIPLAAWVTGVYGLVRGLSMS